MASGLQDGWVPTVIPDEKGMLCWSWRKVKDAGPSSQFYIKMIHHYKGIHPDKLYEALTTEVRTKWDTQDVFQVIESDEQNGEQYPQGRRRLQKKKTSMKVGSKEDSK